MLLNLDINPIAIVGRITLDDIPMALFVPEAPNAPCCNRSQNWVSVLTANGKVQFITLVGASNKITMSRADMIDLTKKGAQSALVGLPSVILSGPKNDTSTDSCDRRTFYMFETNYVATSCEGYGSIDDITTL